MGVIEVKGNYTKQYHDSTVQMHKERLSNDGFEVTDVQRIKEPFLGLIGEYYTKILYRRRESRKE